MEKSKFSEFELEQMNIIASLDTIEELIKHARKMIDWGEYANDHDGFFSAREDLRKAASMVSGVKKSIHEAIVQRGT